MVSILRKCFASAITLSLIIMLVHVLILYRSIKQHNFVNDNHSRNVSWKTLYNSPDSIQSLDLFENVIFRSNSNFTLINQKSVIKFLKEYDKQCNDTTFIRGGKKDLCSCVPRNLEGRFHGFFKINSLLKLSIDVARNYEYIDNMWIPKNCIPRQSVAIVVPFRNRTQHLRIFLNVVHRHMQKQLLGYNIFIINQVSPHLFNRGYLLNIGFHELMRKEKKFNCIIMHDVDLLPEDDRNIYTCNPKFPRHLPLFLDKKNYRKPYYGFGGVVAMTPLHFKLVNGFSTKYFGWGGEDDDLKKRISKAKMKITRYPQPLTTYTSLIHHRDSGNSVNPKRFDLLKHINVSSGLNESFYIVTKQEDLRLYTNISVVF